MYIFNVQLSNKYFNVLEIKITNVKSISRMGVSRIIFFFFRRHELIFKKKRSFSQNLKQKSCEIFIKIIIFDF